VLTALEQRAYERNRSLQVAGRHIFEARAQLAISARNLFVQQGSLSAGAARLDNTGVGPFPPEQIWTDHFRATAGWELDFREKYRRQIQSDHARLRASEAAYDNALVSLFSDAALTAASQSALIGVDNARLHPSFSLTGTHEASKET
jgi:outer membrane protein TolC